MRNWTARMMASCTQCGCVYVATPSANDAICVTVSTCRRCGGDTFEPIGER